MSVEKEDIEVIIASHLAPIQVDLSAIRQTLESYKQDIAKIHEAVSKIKVDEVRIKSESREITILDHIEIRDTNWHRSEIVDATKYDINTVWIRNDLDKSVEARIMGNLTQTHLNAAIIKDGLILEPHSTLAKNINIYTSDWLPFIFVEVKALELPTSGNISVKIIQRKW